MQFTASLLGLVAMAVSVSAHGKLASPAALPNTTPFQNIRIPDNGCGQGVDVSGRPTATFKAGSTASITWNINNGDGGGPLSVKFDTTGKGTSFNAVATVTKNLDGQNGGIPNSFPRGDHKIEVTIPNAKCERCVLQVKQALNGREGFGSCAVVTIN
ncbi:hypothetical protein RB596_004961 [Gaeumannomyces avenae]